MFYFQLLIRFWLYQISPHMSVQIVSFLFFWMLGVFLQLGDSPLPFWIAVAGSTLVLSISVVLWGSPNSKKAPESIYAIVWNVIAAGVGLWYIFSIQEE